MNTYSSLKASLIISVYKNTTALKAVLDSLKKQTEKSFEIIISEDGESPQMKSFCESYPFTNKHIHITQPDEGWRKNRALNNAIKTANSDYLIFIDGDCVVHPHFVEQHIRLSRKNGIVAGKRVKLNEELSQLLLNDVSNYKYVQRKIIQYSVSSNKHNVHFAEEGLYIAQNSPMGFIPKLRMMYQLKGCNMSFSKKAILSINGFDEDYKLPAVGEDIDLTWRFKEAGYKLISARNLAVVYHIWHKENWNDQSINKKLMEEKIRKNEYICKNGINKFVLPIEKNHIRIGVIISTYNNPEWLEKTLWGYLYQTRMADEIVIADDGSNDETRRLIESFKGILPIRHVWHEDRGFQKSAILNKAIAAATADYLIFTDQDCIPREDFIEVHARYAEEGFFLSGGYFKLPMVTSKTITKGDVESGNAFNLGWLNGQGVKFNFKCTKLLRSKLYATILNAVTPARASWNGCNASGWRKDMIAINGFNEDMHYGGQDREFGERLVNLGIRPKQIRYSAIVLHLDHARPYKTKESIAANRAIRKKTREMHLTVTNNGIRKIT